MSSESKEVGEIIKDWLRANDFDGLFNGWMECACNLDDMYPCGEPQENCEAGWMTPCDGSCEFGNCDWHISLEKEKRGHGHKGTGKRADSGDGRDPEQS
jgi:hypothetical protein